MRRLATGLNGERPVGSAWRAASRARKEKELAAIAFLTGMAAEECGPAELAVRDPSPLVVILVRAVNTDTLR